MVKVKINSRISPGRIVQTHGQVSVLDANTEPIAQRFLPRDAKHPRY